METKKNIYEVVTNRIVAEMEKGIIPWQKPWGGVEDGAINYVTRRPYSMLNQMLLGRAGEWLSYKQVTEAGGRIKKGAKAGMVVFYSAAVHTGTRTNAETGEEEEVEFRYPLLRYYNVFHIEDCEGIASKIQAGATAAHEPMKEAEAVITEYVTREGLRFQNDKPSDKAYYSPSRDEVVVPMLSQYRIKEEYYSTTFHELTHSTMKESRCNRKSENRVAAFGGEEYSREELVAEIGSAMLCSSVGIECERAFRNSVAYIQGWLTRLKNDPRMIVWASGRAEKAARFILGKNDAE